ncbi:DUF1493 family protein [Enterobacteriaceae bacterium H20N1]|uniref:DUF1493 family protein n=1 Tax=Dryocola boscaweniae TaxID=2925397 RepID=A0A9X3API7_9ENTR|nr:DUF1493 family protein [Dryocola boscaweniae]MCT4701045.1 DUF1493 family protein [Dryocola boscaweniae]MCT4718089.1 DUF1493 family protein [Dryocola boscaweniae]
MDMVDSIKLKVYELVRTYAGSYLFNIKKVKLTPETDLNIDLDIDKLEVEDLMHNFFEKFNVARGDFKLIIRMCLCGGIYSRKKIDVPDFTLGMLIESAKAGKGLYD